MEIELREIRDFLSNIPPFDHLPAETLDRLPEQLQIRYLRRGSPFPPDHVDKPLTWLLRSGAIELRDPRQRLIGRLGEGSVLADACQQDTPTTHGEAIEDSLLYSLPCATVRKLREQQAAFDHYFSESLRTRMRQALHDDLTGVPANTGDIGAEIVTLLKRAPVCVDATTSIRQAAQRMTERQVSSLLVTRGNKLVGIVTDSDLRRRVVAEGRAYDEAVEDVMSANIETIPPHASLMRAMLTMTRLRVHHLPVVDEHDGLVGIISENDIARYQSTNSVFIASDIRKAGSLDELAAISQRLPSLQLHLASANASARHIGESISCIADSITQRLLEMAEARLGPPPAPYLWLAGGSQARGEQTSHSDQDNAMILSDDVRDDDLPYFESIARFVSDGLNACGYVYCPGNAMANNPEWRQPLAKWRAYFQRWIGRPEPRALMLSSIFFDLKPVRGDNGLFEPLHAEILRKTRDNSIFIAHMVSNALSHRPPLGFFRNFVLIHDGKHDDTLDIKHRGITPITDIARVTALAEGLPAVNTHERLRAAMGTPSLSQEMGRNLQDALEFIARLRIRHQARQIQAGEPPDNYLPPTELSELERAHLKDAFRIIQSMQELLEHRYHVGSLG